MKRLDFAAVVSFPLAALGAFATLAGCAGGGSAPPASAPAASASTAASAEPPAPELDAAPAPPPPASPTPTPTAPPPSPSPPPSTPVSTSEPSDAGPSFDMTVVFDVYKQHKDTLRAACWDHSKSAEKAYLGKANIRLSPTGKVISSKTEGTDEVASTCVDKQIKKWKFPPPNGTATVVLPVHMHRD